MDQMTDLGTQFFKGERHIFPSQQILCAR